MKTQEIFDAICDKEWVYKTSIKNAPQHHPALGKRGFTLIELLMVIAIIGVLALMVIPQFANLKIVANIARCKSEIRTVEKSIIAYNLDNAKYPDGPLDATVTTTLKDPWGNSYQYYNIQKNGTGGKYVDQLGHAMNDDFDLYSLGINGAGNHDLTDVNCIDDIIRVADGRVVELGSDY